MTNPVPSTSPEHYHFAIESARRRSQDATEPEAVQSHLHTVQYYEQASKEKTVQEQDPEWRENNLEYDLRSTDWILDKVRASEVYAQNIYAALCNNDFQRNDVMPILKNETWSCSWRHAGGVVADMIGKGDYMDWYCSGSRSGPALRTEDYITGYVNESTVTDEVLEDLFKLGWIVSSLD
jgi:hypothetical protein